MRPSRSLSSIANSSFSSFRSSSASRHTLQPISITPCRTCRPSSRITAQTPTIRSLSSRTAHSAQASPSAQTTVATKQPPPPQPQTPAPQANTTSPETSTETDPSQIDWAKSFHGLSTVPFSKEAADILQAEVDAKDVEIKPDGIIYLPEIKYRRILNKAFGPGGWGLAPRGETIVTEKAVTREYALLVHGRLVSIARGEQDYFSKDGIPTASEGCKSNAMVRCCKDLGIASELWDPRWIRQFKAKNTREVFVEHQVSKKRTKLWLLKGDPVSYPYKETKFGVATTAV